MSHEHAESFAQKISMRTDSPVSVLMNFATGEFGFIAGMNLQDLPECWDKLETYQGGELVEEMEECK